MERALQCKIPRPHCGFYFSAQFPSCLLWQQQEFLTLCTSCRSCSVITSHLWCLIKKEPKWHFGSWSWPVLAAKRRISQNSEWFSHLWTGRAKLAASVLAAAHGSVCATDFVHFLDTPYEGWSAGEAASGSFSKLPPPWIPAEINSAAKSTFPASVSALFYTQL